jgi:hypothetical protein
MIRNNERHLTHLNVYAHAEAIKLLAKPVISDSNVSLYQLDKLINHRTCEDNTLLYV